ncbi:MAG TPA: four helix bundle protein [Cyclobacteriaceae bacterium]|nr:four helix bundle protein [Cyclobacteriaceae bacterium]
MTTVKNFEELDCWKEARMLVKIVFKVCEDGRLAKDFGTSDQLRRAALSVMNNIAEGHGRHSTGEFIRFLDFAQSSALEVKSITYVLSDVDYLTLEQATAIRTRADHTRNLIRGLMNYLQKYAFNQPT